MRHEMHRELVLNTTDFYSLCFVPRKHLPSARNSIAAKFGEERRSECPTAQPEQLKAFVEDLVGLWITKNAGIWGVNQGTPGEAGSSSLRDDNRAYRSVNSCLNSGWSRSSGQPLRISAFLSGSARA